MNKQTILVLFLLVLFYRSFEASDEALNEALTLMKQCENVELVVCLKERLIKLIDLLPREFNLTSSILIKANNRTKKNFFRNLDEVVLPKNNTLRNKVLDEILLSKISEFLGNHFIQLKIPDDAIAEYRRSFEERRKKKKKSIIPYLLLFKAKAVALGAFFAKLISLLAFKAVVLAKLALILTLGVSLKKYSDHSSRNPIYEPSYEAQWKRLLHDDNLNLQQTKNFPQTLINTKGI